MKNYYYPMMFTKQAFMKNKQTYQIQKVQKKLISLTLEICFFLDYYLVESNGTIKNGNKRKDSSPPPISNSNNLDPVRKDKFLSRHRFILFF
jgi:hypothetical protein